MGKQDRVEDEPVLTDEGAVKPAASGTEIVPKMALACIIGPPVDKPPGAGSCIEALPTGADRMTSIAASKIDLDSIEAPQIAPEMVEFKPSESESAPEPPAPPSEAPDASTLAEEDLGRLIDRLSEAPGDFPSERRTRLTSEAHRFARRTRRSARTACSSSG